MSRHGDAFAAVRRCRFAGSSEPSNSTAILPARQPVGPHLSLDVLQQLAIVGISMEAMMG